MQNDAGYQAIAEKVVDRPENKYIKNVPVNNRMAIDTDSIKVIKQVVLDNHTNISKNTNCIKNDFVHSWVYGGNKSTYIVTNAINDKFVFNEIDLQIDIVNDKNGEPEHIIATKPSKKLKGAFVTI